MKLKDFVKKCGSQEKTAQVFGVCLSTISKWLRGKVKNPKGLYQKTLDEHGIQL